MGERGVRNAEVEGSNPLPSTNSFVLQVEGLTCDGPGADSRPVGGTCPSMTQREACLWLGVV